MMGESSKKVKIKKIVRKKERSPVKRHDLGRPSSPSLKKEDRSNPRIK